MNKILILGAKGMLGGELVKVFGGEAVGWDRSDFDFAKISNFKFQISNLSPTAIINCVAYNNVDGADQHQEIAFKINSEAVGHLAALTKHLDIPLVHFSTNYVFNGEKGEYSELDLPDPISVYAQSKYQGELAIEKTAEKFYIIRTALLFGPKGQSNSSKKSFVSLMLELAQKDEPVKAISDEINSLTYAVDLAAQVKLLLSQSSPYGIYHITNSGRTSWYDFAKEIFAIRGININLVPVPSSQFPRTAKRPKKAVLINTKLPQLRSWQEALREYLTTM